MGHHQLFCVHLSERGQRNAEPNHYLFRRRADQLVFGSEVLALHHHFCRHLKGVGYNSVIYLAAITGIDKSYYEAAVIDGASKWKQVRYITIPLLKPLMIILTILAIGGIFRSDFGLFYQLPKDSGALYPVTNVIDTFVYRGLINMGDIGMSTAAGLYQSFVGLVLILVANYIVRKSKKIMRSSNPRRCNFNVAAIYANRPSVGQAFKEETIMPSPLCGIRFSIS